MAGVSYCATRSLVTAWEVNLRTYRVTYKVATDNAADGPQVVLSYLSDQGFTVGVKTYVVGNDVDQLAVLIKIGAPRRAGNDTLLKLWLVDMDYEFSLENTPSLRPVKIEPYFISGTEPIESAFYYGAYNRVNKTWAEVQLTKPTYKITGGPYPIGNSSRVPLLPAPERQTLQAAYRVSWIKRTALTDAAYYAETWNAFPFTLITTSRRYFAPGLGVDPTIFFKTFPPNTLRIAEIQQPIKTIYGQDWYEVTIEFVEEDFFIHELDRGVTARAEVGDPKADGGFYSEGDFPEGAVGQRTILDGQGQPVGDPVLLDGQGKPLFDKSTTLPPVYLRWNKGDTTDFNQIGIGNYN